MKFPLCFRKRVDEALAVVQEALELAKKSSDQVSLANAQSNRLLEENAMLRAELGRTTDTLVSLASGEEPVDLAAMKPVTEIVQ